MSLVDGPTGSELAREELSDGIYADAQPSLLVRAVEWLTEHLDEWLDSVRGVPGGQWLLAAAATAIVGVAVWLAWKWHQTQPARNPKVFDTTEPSPATTLYSAATHHYLAKEWGPALVAATRAIVTNLQEQALVPIGPGVTINEVRDAVADPAVRDTLDTFEKVRYGGQTCTATQAQSAIGLAGHEAAEARR